MKVPLLSSLLLTMGFVSQAAAIERPKALDDRSAPLPEAPRAVVEVEEAAEVEKALPWLGVFGVMPDETLRRHLSLEGGVVLRFVAPESPAAAAGLEAHDILMEFAGQKIDSQEALREAVLQFAPGEEVTVGMVRKGESVEKTVKLGERPAELNVGRQRMQPGLDLGEFPELEERFGELERLFPQGREGMNFGGDFQAQMKEMEERLKQLEKLPGMDLDIEELLKDIPRGNEAFNLSLNRTSSVKLMDDEGSVELRVSEDSKEVTVRDLEGEIVYEGPWDTEQDRAAVGPEIRERIEKLNLDEQANGIRLHFKQVPGLPDLVPELLPE